MSTPWARRQSAVAGVVIVGVLAGVLALSSGDGNARGATAQTSSTWCTDQSSIVVLGDSMSSGHGVTDSSNAWVSRIQQAYPGTDVTNLAANGALASDFLPAGEGVQPRPAGNMVPTAVEQVLVIQPALVIIAVGGNEYGTDRHPELTYRTNLVDLSDHVQAVSPTSTLLFVHTTGFDYRWATPPVDHQWADYGSAMQQVAADESAAYLDLTEFLPWADTDTAGLFLVDEYGAGNTVHLDDAGHVAAGAVIHQQLRMC